MVAGFDGDDLHRRFLAPLGPGATGY